MLSLDLPDGIGFVGGCDRCGFSLPGAIIDAGLTGDGVAPTASSPAKSLKFGQFGATTPMLEGFFCLQANLLQAHFLQIHLI